MKKIVYTLIFTALTVAQTFAQTVAPVVVGGSEKGDTYATMEILSQKGTKGFMPPRLTTTQITALGSNLNAASKGLTVFNTDTNCLQYWQSDKWSDCNTYSNAAFTVDCSASTIKGAYNLDKAVDNNDYMEVKVNVTKEGPFSFYSDTKNGVRFYLTTILELGSQIVQIPAVGTPKAVGDFTYNLFDQAGNAICPANANFKTTVVDNTANFAIKCTETAIVGSFYDNIPADSQKLVVKVSVSGAGNYNIKTDTVNGLWFEGSGNVNFGTTEIVLEAKGVATTIAGDTGIRTFTLQDKNGTSLGCTVTTSLMAAKAVFTINCASARLLGTENGIFIPDYVFRDVDKLTVSINATRTGPISLFTDPSQPVVYSYVGNIEKRGVQTITLTPTKTALNYHGPWDSSGSPRMFFTLKFFNFDVDMGCSEPLFYRIYDYVAQYQFTNTLATPEMQEFDHGVFDKVKLFVPIATPLTVYGPVTYSNGPGMIAYSGTAAGITITFSGTGGGLTETRLVGYMSGTLTAVGNVSFPIYDMLTGEFRGGYTINFKG